MMWPRFFSVLLISTLACYSCSKNSEPDPDPVPPPVNFTFLAARLDNAAVSGTKYGASRKPALRISLSARINRATADAAVTYRSKTGTSVTYSIGYENNDSTLVIQPAADLDAIMYYTVTVSTVLKSSEGRSLVSSVAIPFITQIDSSRKFPAISDDALLTKVQQQTFRYFWDYGHPVSGMARERSNGDDNLVTSGGSGFGIMAIVTGVHRGFVTRAEGLARLQKIVGFLKTAQTFHGAFPHWMNGNTGGVIPFSANDNGADLVETSLLMQGLLTARQYFDRADIAEMALRTDINLIWNKVEWDWFRKNNENVLYWHWSPDKQWAMNLPIKGWNECLITYVLAASSTTHGVPKAVYDAGWASNGGMRNGATYYGHQLPLGPNAGGPLFLSHYSFLGINPNGLQDAYANYETQVKNHALINQAYCKLNPGGFYGYSDSVWGLTASDIENGYQASSPTSDAGFIAPTAALSSFPYTPAESMKALKFFYYALGDKLWKDYGFIDAFSLHRTWFAGSHLAIDQGPIIIMIENYRSGLLWDLFTSCPEIKTGMKGLGFTAPYL